MGSNLTNRVTALENKIVKPEPEFFCIICEGAKPIPKEQAQIDEAKARGMFVICRLIVDPASL